MKANFPPDPILLISDLHLDPARPALTQAFFHFLDTRARHASALYILGDFFNVWLGDDDDAPLCGEVSAALHRCSEHGTAVYLMHGNRDFLLGSTWAQSCGASLINEPYLLETTDHRYLLLHGDVLCTRDTAYMQFRAMVRDPAWQQAFLAQPLPQRRAFADEARARSKSESSNKAEDIMDVTPGEADKLLAHYRADTLIHGHTHRPAVHREAHTRMVLGDWDEAGWFIEIDQDRATLHSFPLSA